MELLTAPAHLRIQHDVVAVFRLLTEWGGYGE